MFYVKSPDAIRYIQAITQKLNHLHWSILYFTDEKLFLIVIKIPIKIISQLAICWCLWFLYKTL